MRIDLPRYLLIVVLILGSAWAAHAQTGSQKNVTALNTEINTNFPDNSNGAIIPRGARQATLDMIASTGNFLTPGTWQALQTFAGGTTHPLVDGQVMLGSNNLNVTAQSIYSPFSNPANSAIYDVGRFVLDLESVSGGAITQADALGAYANCNVPLGVAPATGNCVASFGFAALGVANASGWGANFVCTDNTTNTNYGGSQNRKCISLELDLRIYDTGGTAQGTGLLISMDGTGTFASTLYGIDIEAGPASPKFAFAVNCGTHATSIGCLNIGPAVTGATAASQNIVWEYVTGSTQFAMVMGAPSGGGFSFTATAASVGIAMDWSTLTINTCTLKIAFGCVLNGGGTAQFAGAGIGASAVAAAALTVQGPDATSSNFAARFFNSGPTLLASFRDDGAVFLDGPLTLGVGTSSISLQGSGSGTINLQTQAAAGNWNWNWPITAGTAGQCLVSQGGVTTAMTWGACAGGLTVGTTTISGSCTNGFNLFNNAGVLGCQANGSGGSLTVGTTTVSGGTTQQILYDNAGVVGEITKGNNCVYGTNGSGVPSCATTLPSAVVASSLTSVGTLTGGATGAGFTVALATSTITGQLALANGGSNANLTASVGGIVYSTASAFAILSGTVTAGQCLLSGSSAAPTWGSCSAGGGGITIGSTTITSGTTQQILYDNGGVIGEITKGNNCVYATNGSGVPSCATTLADLTISGTSSPQLTVQSTGANPAFIDILETGGSQQAGIDLCDTNCTTTNKKWQIVKQANQNLAIIDNVASATIFTAVINGGTMSLTPQNNLILNPGGAHGVSVGSASDPGSGNLAASGSLASGATGSATNPNLVTTVCGANCGWYAPASGQMAWTIGGLIMDFGITTASTFTVDVNVSFGGHSLYGGGAPGNSLNFFSTFSGAPSGDSVTFSGSTIALRTLGGTFLLDYNSSVASVWTFSAPVISTTTISALAHLSRGTAPTGNTGTCSTGVTVTGGASVGNWTSTNACNIGSTIILSGMPAVPTAYNCDATDITTAAVVLQQTASSVTSVTFTVRSTNASANDNIRFKCLAY